jgi:hypothetical protein
MKIISLTDGYPEITCSYEEYQELKKVFNSVRVEIRISVLDGATSTCTCQIRNDYKEYCTAAHRLTGKQIGVAVEKDIKNGYWCC